MGKYSQERPERQTDGRTVGQGDSYIPPMNLVCGGYKYSTGKATFGTPQTTTDTGSERDQQPRTVLNKLIVTDLASFFKCSLP